MLRKLAAITAFSTLLASAPVAMAGDLTVTVDGISPVQGTVMLGLFDEASYNGDGAVAGANLVVEAESVTTTFEGLEPGEYAIRLYHDVNDDGEMNTNPFGMPIEPYAFSNNAKGRFGPAKWKDAKFTVGADAETHSITIGK